MLTPHSAMPPIELTKCRDNIAKYDTQLQENIVVQKVGGWVGGCLTRVSGGVQVDCVAVVDG